MTNYVASTCKELEKEYGAELSKTQFYYYFIKNEAAENIIKEPIRFYKKQFTENMKKAVKDLSYGFFTLSFTLLAFAAAPIAKAYLEFSSINNAWSAYKEYKENK